MDREKISDTPVAMSAANARDDGEDLVAHQEQTTETVVSGTGANPATAARNRREQIKKLEARLQRAIARDNAVSRKERNGQLFVWGAMVEALYRDGNAHERDLLRQWAEQKLTDRRHLQRAECGFARLEDEAAGKADA